MALCKELIALASCSGRIDDSFSPNLQSRHRSCRKPSTARFFANKNFVGCRVVRSRARDGANTFRTGFREDFAGEREWKIRVLQSDVGGQKVDSEQFLRFYATCEKGLEEILAAELSSPLIGALQVEAGSGGVSFVGTQSTGYNANLWLRTGDRVLCELARGLLPKGSDHVDHVYEFVREAVDWPLVLVDDGVAQTPSPRSGERLFIPDVLVSNVCRDCDSGVFVLVLHACQVDLLWHLFVSFILHTWVEEASHY
jgi:hypothetical protein